MVRRREPKNILGSVPVGRSENALAGTDPLTGSVHASMDLDAEWQQIQNMLNARIIPSTERIKEYLQVGLQNTKTFVKTKNNLDNLKIIKYTLIVDTIVTTIRKGGVIREYFHRYIKS